MIANSRSPGFFFTLRERHARVSFPFIPSPREIPPGNLDGTLQNGSDLPRSTLSVIPPLLFSPLPTRGQPRNWPAEIAGITVVDNTAITCNFVIRTSVYISYLALWRLHWFRDLKGRVQTTSPELLCLSQNWKLIFIKFAKCVRAIKNRYVSKYLFSDTAVKHVCYIGVNVQQIFPSNKT